MAIYSIRDLQKLSGIKAHTIRIWEQRYNIIEPKRTASNIRYYTEEDLKFLMNIAFLNRKGIRISKISQMSTPQILQKVEELSKTDAETNDHFQALAMAMIELDEHKIGDLLEQCIKHFGVEKTILDILTPFLEKASMLWLSGSISIVHEQFASSLIRRKILAAINFLPQYREQKPQVVILYLPEAEQQELYLIFAEYLLKKRNIKVIYLGCKISLDDVKFTCSIHQPDYIYTIVSEQHKCYVANGYISELSQLIAPAHLLVSGTQMTDKNIEEKNVTVLDDLNELVSFF